MARRRPLELRAGHSARVLLASLPSAYLHISSILRALQRTNALEATVAARNMEVRRLLRPSVLVHDLLAVEFRLVVLILERLHRVLLILVSGVESVRVVVPLMEEVNHPNAVSSRLVLARGSLAGDVVVATVMDATSALRSSLHLTEVVHEAASVRILLLYELLDVTLALATLTVSLRGAISVRLIWSSELRRPHYWLAVELVMHDRLTCQATALVITARLRTHTAIIVEAQSLIRLLLSTRWPLPLLKLLTNEGRNSRLTSLQRHLVQSGGCSGRAS